MAVTVSISLPGNVIANQKANGVMALYNGGASSVSLSAVQFASNPVGSAVNFGNMNFGPNVSVAVGSSATIYLPFDVVFLATPIQGAPGASTQPIQIFAVCSFSDDSVATSNLWAVSPSAADNVPAGSTAVAGQVRFDNGLDSGLFVAVSSVHGSP